MYAPLALIALAIEALLEYPQWLFRLAGHPVSWIGRLITWGEEAWNGPRFSFAQRRANGIAVLIVILTVVVAITVALVWVVEWLLPWPLSLLLLGVLAATLIAQRSLDQHVAAVADALERGGAEAGRQAVGMIVGRDTGALDEAGVSRAAIESLAENFSDGVTAPLLWMVVGGLPGGALYKAVNTADSMIGNKDNRFLAFGWAAARLDDMVNLPASRLSALLLVGAAAIVPGADHSNATRAVLRDARKHRSPNAGWPEAAMAGALGLRLAGPRAYDGEIVDDSWMGDGRAEAGSADIRRALRVFRIAGWIQAGALALLASVVIL
jgi:adenosylcobinamide-phosphate synthase